MKLMEPRAHGYLDYLFDLVLFCAPSLFDFGATASACMYFTATLHLVMNLVTQYPLGVVRWMRFSTHGALEVWASVGLVLLPWLAGFNMEDSARNFYIIAGLGLFFVWMTTDYRDETDVVSDTIDTVDLGVRPYTTVKHPTTIDFPERRAS